MQHQQNIGYNPYGQQQMNAYNANTMNPQQQQQQAFYNQQQVQMYSGPGPAPVVVDGVHPGMTPYQQQQQQQLHMQMQQSSMYGRYPPNHVNGTEIGAIRNRSSCKYIYILMLFIKLLLGFGKPL